MFLEGVQSHMQLARLDVLRPAAHHDASSGVGHLAGQLCMHAGPPGTAGPQAASSCCQLKLQTLTAQQLSISKVETFEEVHALIWLELGQLQPMWPV